jgi:hypothetical protein
MGVGGTSWWLCVLGVVSLLGVPCGGPPERAGCLIALSVCNIHCAVGSVCIVVLGLRAAVGLPVLVAPVGRPVSPAAGASLSWGAIGVGVVAVPHGRVPYPWGKVEGEDGRPVVVKRDSR